MASVAMIFQAAGKKTRNNLFFVQAFPASLLFYNGGIIQGDCVADRRIFKLQIRMYRVIGVKLVIGMVVDLLKVLTVISIVVLMLNTLKMCTIRFWTTFYVMVKILKCGQNHYRV